MVAIQHVLFVCTRINKFLMVAIQHVLFVCTRINKFLLVEIQHVLFVCTRMFFSAFRFELINKKLCDSEI